MTENFEVLVEEILQLYQEPVIGSGYTNMYGEENIINLVTKYRSLSQNGMEKMRQMVIDFSLSPDLASSFVSVAVLHALGMKKEVEEAYQFAREREDGASFAHHFDIGISLADHFVSG